MAYRSNAACFEEVLGECGPIDVSDNRAKICEKYGWP